MADSTTTALLRQNTEMSTPLFELYSGRPPLLFQHMYCSSYLFRLAIFLPLIALCEIFYPSFVSPLSWRCHATALTHVDTIMPAFSAIYMNTFLVQLFCTGAIIMQWFL